MDSLLSHELRAIVLGMLRRFDGLEEGSVLDVRNRA